MKQNVNALWNVRSLLPEITNSRSPEAASSRLRVLSPHQVSPLPRVERSSFQSCGVKEWTRKSLYCSLSMRRGPSLQRPRLRAALHCSASPPLRSCTCGCFPASTGPHTNPGCSGLFWSRDGGDRVSLYSPGWPQTPGNPLASVSQVLGLEA